MLTKSAVAALAAGLLAGTLTATSAIAAHLGGGLGGGIAGGMHAAAPHIGPSGPAMHGPGVVHPGPRVYGWQGGGPHHHFHHRRGFGVIVGDGYDGYYDYYGYGGGCGWLYRRAVATGSPYWWRRYEDCID